MGLILTVWELKEESPEVPAMPGEGKQGLEARSGALSCL